METPPNEAEHRGVRSAGLGLAALALASAVSGVLTVALIWILPWSAFWALLLYPGIAAVFTLFFSLWPWSRRSTSPVLQKSEPEPVQSRERTRPH